MEAYFSAIDPGKPVNLTRELLVVEHYMKKGDRNRLIGHANKIKPKSATIASKGSDGKIAGDVKSRGFVADRIEVCAHPYFRKKFLAVCNDIYKNQLNPYYNVEVEWYEYPHVLRYHPGGTYGLHADSENLNRETNQWYKYINRDYSSILYLNSDFTGGTLVFPYLNLRVIPQAGMLVAFPSDHRFLHSAEPVQAGIRYAMVTWAAEKNGVRVKDASGPPVVEMSY